jgi:2-isopropylmalate synthase
LEFEYRQSTHHFRYPFCDGVQLLGASMRRGEKLRVARQLERLKVGVIEAGFAASANGDVEAAQSRCR